MGESDIEQRIVEPSKVHPGALEVVAPAEQIDRPAIGVVSAGQPELVSGGRDLGLTSPRLSLAWPEWHDPSHVDSCASRPATVGRAPLADAGSHGRA